MYLYEVTGPQLFSKQLDTHTENQALSACSPSLSCNARKAIYREGPQETGKML